MYIYNVTCQPAAITGDARAANDVSEKGIILPGNITNRTQKC